MYDPCWAVRVALGAGALGLVVTLTACDGAGAKARTKKRNRATVPSAAPQNAAPQPLNCTDPGGDVRGARAGAAPRAPGWTDLTAVTWTRTDSGATVAFTTAAPLANNTGTGDAVYSTTFKQGIVLARVDARMAGGTWRVTSTGGGRTSTVLSLPAVTGRTVTLRLPRRLAAGRHAIDLNGSVHVAASTRAHAGGGPFRDPGCGPASPGRPAGQVMAWPGPGGTPVVTRPPQTTRPRTPARTRTPSRTGPARTPTAKPRNRH